MRDAGQPPAKRRDHQPLRRGRSVVSVSPISVITGSGAGAVGGAGGDCWVSTVLAPGAGSRTVERRRGAGSSTGPGEGSESKGCGDAGAGEGIRGGASRSATASVKFDSTAGGADKSSAAACGGAGSDASWSCQLGVAS
jgi:hypothetical protein